MYYFEDGKISFDDFHCDRNIVHPICREFLDANILCSADYHEYFDSLGPIYRALFDLDSAVLLDVRAN